MDYTNPLVLAALTGLFTYLMTAVGAAGVFLHRNPSARWMDVLLGFSAGVMLAASFWSLLAPSVAIARDRGGLVWLPTSLGFAVGGLTLWGLDKVMPHIHSLMPGVQIHEGITTTWRRSTLLVLAITLHHIPEGLAIGVAAGAAGAGVSHASVGAAIALGLGLGLQNLPEGLAVSMMLYREGASRRRGFFLGQMTGAVEPFAAVAGALLVSLSTALLPYALAFAAGAMVYVVIEELIPECQRSGHADAAVLASIVGFTLMTVLDLALS
ncbi:MAG: ZIP family metal transporter [Coriobacteriia bacterium]|nr:ZIP family metal transporter [Coriobacteriia bacterium]